MVEKENSDDSSEFERKIFVENSGMCVLWICKLWIKMYLI